MSIDNQLPVNANIGSLVERGRNMLVEARTNLSRLEVRDTAKAIAAAAEVLNRRDVQVEASILVQEAERAVYKATPPEKGGRGKTLVAATKVSADTIRNIRKAHSKVSDDDFLEVKRQAVDKQQPVTRQTLKDLGREKAKVEKQAEREAALEAARKRMSETRDIAFESPIKTATCRQMRGHVVEGSLDAVFTDPPYPKTLTPCWDELAAFAVHALRPGGLLLAMTGHVHLPEIIHRLEVPGLDYRWIVSYAYAEGPQQNVHSAKVSVGWKPFLAYSRSGGPLPDFYSQDAFAVPPKNPGHKQAHEWGQNDAGVLKVAKEWLQPGWKVCDPFCGAGAMLAAAREAGCEVSGCDIEPAHVETTRKKLENRS